MTAMEFLPMPHHFTQEKGALRRTTDIICAWADLLRGRERH